MSIKLYARQISDTSTLPAFDYNLYPHAIFDGNPDYRSVMSKHFKYIKLNFDEIAEIADCIRNGGKTFYPDFGEACADLLPREESYSITEVGLIEDVMHAWSLGILFREDCYSHLLTIMEHTSYVWKQINGCTQSEWQTVYYPKNYYDEAALMALEREYFNLGTAWEVIEDFSSTLEINDASLFDGFESEIVAQLSDDSWNDYTEIKQELAQFYGYSPEEIRLFPCTGAQTVIKYTYGEGI